MLTYSFLQQMARYISTTPLDKKSLQDFFSHLIEWRIITHVLVINPANIQIFPHLFVDKSYEGKVDELIQTSQMLRSQVMHILNDFLKSAPQTEDKLSPEATLYLIQKLLALRASIQTNFKLLAPVLDYTIRDVLGLSYQSYCEILYYYNPQDQCSEPPAQSSYSSTKSDSTSSRCSPVIEDQIQFGDFQSPSPVDKSPECTIQFGELDPIPLGDVGKRPFKTTENLSKSKTQFPLLIQFGDIPNVPSIDTDSAVVFIQKKAPHLRQK